MIPAYLELVSRIRLELGDLENAVSRAERAIQAARERPEDQDLYNELPGWLAFCARCGSG